MKISAKGLYAVRFMTYLAAQGNDILVSLKEVSDAQGISKKYLEQIAPGLVSAKLVRSVRGASGGYRLARAASAISLLDVLNVTEGGMVLVPCVTGDEPDCGFPGPCREFGVWKGLNEVVETYLGNISLQDVIDQSSPVAADSYSI